jgi:hypothetical protein
MLAAVIYQNHRYTTGFHVSWQNRHTKVHFGQFHWKALESMQSPHSSDSKSHHSTACAIALRIAQKVLPHPTHTDRDNSITQQICEHRCVFAFIRVFVYDTIIQAPISLSLIRILASNLRARPSTRVVTSRTTPHAGDVQLSFVISRCTSVRFFCWGSGQGRMRSRSQYARWVEVGSNERVIQIQYVPFRFFSFSLPERQSLTSGQIF